MIKTICIDKEVPADTNRAEFMEKLIEKGLKEMVESYHSWITSISTDGRFITITANYSENYPGESKPSVVFYRVLALNDSNESYDKLSKLKYSEEEIRDTLLREAEVEAEEYGSIKAWNMVYVHRYAIIVASI